MPKNILWHKCYLTHNIVHFIFFFKITTINVQTMERKKKVGKTKNYTINGSYGSLKLCSNIKTKLKRGRTASLLSSFSSNSPGELDVFRHNSDTFSVDGAQICVFKQADEIGFGCFLQSQQIWVIKTRRFKNGQSPMNNGGAWTRKK